MMHAYDECFAERAKYVLAGMMDFASHNLHYEMEEFFGLFIASGLAGRLERGDTEVIMGKSGAELAFSVLDICGIEYERSIARYTSGLSKEYIFGCVLAEFQWETALTFADIIKLIPLQKLSDEYDQNHRQAVNEIPWQLMGEDRRRAMDEISRMHYEHLLDMLREEVLKDKPSALSNLRKMRLLSGMSQSQLAEATGIPVRTIQQYEQKRKDLGKAQSLYLIKLSRALSCDPSSLLD